MGIVILIVSVLAIAGAVVWFFIKNKKTSQEEVINKPASEPTPVEVPKEEEKEPEKSKEEVIKPKFKVEDFILNGDVTDGGKPEIFKVLKVCDTWYDVENVYDGRKAIITFKQEYSCRMWNISDAKAGDVLAVEIDCKSPFVAIYNGQNNMDNETFDSYCFIGRSGNFYFGEKGHLAVGIHPATEEQCNLLFSKMKEAGYEWNPDTKELKEIAKPQEPAVEVLKEEQNVTSQKENNENKNEVIKEDKYLSLDECINAFKDYISIPKGSTTYNYLKDLYDEASAQVAAYTTIGIPLLYLEENFPVVTNYYGDNSNYAASFNTLVGWLFALQLSELKPKKRNHLFKVGYELGGYTYDSPVFGYRFEADPNVARLVASIIYVTMRAIKKPNISAMRAEVDGTSYSYGLSYYLDMGLNHLKTPEEIQKNVINKGGFYVDLREFMPSSAGPYNKNYKSRPINIMTDEKDEYSNLKMDRDIHEFIIETFNLSATDPAIHQRTVQAIADKEQSVNHLFGSNKKVGEYEFHCVFGKDTIGRKIKTDGGVANLAWSIQAIATYFRLVLQNKVDSPAYYGRLRPGCDWTEEKKKNSSIDDRRNILVDITIEDNDGEKESSFGYYNSDGIWVHTQVERDKFAEEQKNHLGANSYPSGHSSGIWCVAMMLAEIMPDKADLIMKEANEFAINRTVTRFHWTSDTIFGRVLGSMANAMCHATTDYTTLLKIAKKEAG